MKSFLFSVLAFTTRERCSWFIYIDEYTRYLVNTNIFTKTFSPVFQQTVSHRLLWQKQYLDVYAE